MKTIQLTQGKTVIVDDDDYEYINSFSWYFLSSGYAARTENNPHKIILMHRVIMNVHGFFVVDHINHDTLDNRKINLRVCTHAENNRNRIIASDRDYKGIYRHGDCWRACISLNNKSFHIGTFNTKEDAALAYNEKAKELFGVFAFLNETKRVCNNG